MRVLSRSSRAAIVALIAQEDAHRGLPRTERGRKVGEGVHAATITTTSSAEPIELDDGTWGMPESAITAPAISRVGIADRPVRERV